MGKILIKNITHFYQMPNITDIPFSIGIDDGGLIQYSSDFLEADYCDVVDASNLYLSPGWIDLHTHIYEGVCDIGLNPDMIGPIQGVAALVDAGSAGHITFPGLRDYILKQRDYEIYSFLNYGSIGITRCNVICDYETDDFIQPEETLACIENNREYIKGLKVRACKVVFKGRRGVELVKAASDLAVKAKVPLMVHVGEPEPRLEDILKILHQGDIVTHCFHGKPGNIMCSSGNKIISEAYDARERGVLFDIGHGAASFDYNVGKLAISQGFKPDLISTDLHAHSYPTPAGSLAATMSKMISCGLSPAEVIEMVTVKAAEVLKLDGWGVKEGTKAAFTLFKIEEREHIYFDANKNPITSRVQIVPVMTISGTHIYPVHL